MQCVGLSARMIRYYESHALLGQVNRTIGFTRYYTFADIQRLKTIVRLKKEGMRLPQLKAYFNSLDSRGDSLITANFLIIQEISLETFIVLVMGVFLLEV